MWVRARTCFLYCLLNRLKFVTVHLGRRRIARMDISPFTYTVTSIIFERLRAQREIERENRPDNRPDAASRLLCCGYLRNIFVQEFRSVVNLQIKLHAELKSTRFVSEVRLVAEKNGRTKCSRQSKRLVSRRETE